MDLKLEVLTKEAFAPFGDVIEIEGSPWYHINQGGARRYHKLCVTEASGENAQIAISMARSEAVQFPLKVQLMERHAFGSQAFYPCSGTPFIAIVTTQKDDKPDEANVRAFFVRADQGVNYGKGVWHHPLIALVPDSDFVVVDRIGGGNNCDEVLMPITYELQLPKEFEATFKK